MVPKKEKNQIYLCIHFTLTKWFYLESFFLARCLYVDLWDVANSCIPLTIFHRCIVIVIGRIDSNSKQKSSWQTEEFACRECEKWISFLQKSPNEITINLKQHTNENWKILMLQTPQAYESVNQYGLISNAKS